MTPDELAALVAERAQQRAATYQTRLTERARQREQLTASRAGGLRLRHAAKTSTTNPQQ